MLVGAIFHIWVYTYVPVFVNSLLCVQIQLHKFLVSVEQIRLQIRPPISGNGSVKNRYDRVSTFRIFYVFFVKRQIRAKTGHSTLEYVRT